MPDRDFCETLRRLLEPNRKREMLDLAIFLETRADAILKVVEAAKIAKRYIECPNDEYGVLHDALAALDNPPIAGKDRPC